MTENNNIKIKQIDEIIEKYIQQMNDKEKIAYYIAKEHLGSSFDIEKSIGFKKYNAKK